MSVPRVDRSPLTLSSGRSIHSQIQDRISEAPRCSLDQKVKALIEGLQESIVKSESLDASFSWIEECARIQTFYSSLRHLPDASLALRICIAIRRDVYQKARDVPWSTEREQVQRALISKAWEHIGNIAVCAEKIPLELKVVIETSPLEEVLSFTEKRIAGDLQKSWGALHMKSKVADAHGLQDEGRVYLTELPKELARLLLTSQGQINLGMIRQIKERFFPTTRMLSEGEQGILSVLDQMDSSWQKLFDPIQGPRNLVVGSNAMICADLGLSPEENITKLHCQQEVLGAVLSQMCQPQVGDYLTIALLLKRHREFLRTLIEDYASLIRNGCLTRWVDGNLETFFFENTLSSDAIYKKITLKQNGALIEFSGSPFWKCPNLIAACRLMGIPDLEKEKESFLNQAEPKTKGASVTWEELIDFFAQRAAGSDKDAGALLCSGRYGFCLDSNRLLKAWETSLTAAIDPSVRTNISKTVMHLFKSVFRSKETKGAKVSYYRRALMEEMQLNFKQIFNHSFHLVYDEAIPFSCNKGVITANGFKLYKRDLADLTAKGTRVADPKEFRSLILGAIGTLSAHKKEVPVIEALKECALHREFLKTAICEYDEENADETDPVLNYAFIEQTPMTSLVTGRSPEFMALDTMNRFNPKWMLHSVKWINEGKEFQEFLKSKMSVEDWIKKTVVDPGMKISSAKMDHDSKVRCQEKLKIWLFEQFIDKAPQNLKKLDRFFREINSNEMTVRQFAERSYFGLLSIFRSNKEIAQAISLMFDSLLLQSLAETELWDLQQSAVRFASVDAGFVFFCCFFNPRTECIDLGSIGFDKTGLKPVDQQEWEEIFKTAFRSTKIVD